MKEPLVLKPLSPEEERKANIRAKNIMLWLFLASVTLFFAALTSVYVVRKDGSDWLEFSLPEPFTHSTIVLLMSSLLMALLQWLVRTDRSMNRWLLSAGIAVIFGLGIWFTQLQWEGYKALVAQNIFLVDNRTGNVSGSFFYIITGAHFAHIISGLLALVWTFAKAIRGNLTAQSHHNLSRTAIYWHFLDFLWLYLFLFLSYADQLI
ncbi:MAG: cytochrome c oxidase subunit 3 [Flavobacteriales bacterium]|jgi:cytochrome c oxidase subunit 3|nr:cytochrome c oxidase subunit 3 [Bacteroidota bacterium]